MIEILGQLREMASPAALICAGLAAVAAYLLVGHPGDRMIGRSVQPYENGPPSKIALLVRGRVDAMPATRRLMLSGGGAVGVCAALSKVAPGPDWLLWLAGPVLAVVGAVGLGRLMPRSAARRRQQLILQAPQALELMGSCLDAGMPVRQPCRAIVDAFDGPIADDLGRVVALVELGASDATAWRSLHDHPQLGPAADDLARSVESGTMLVEGLRRHAADARQARQGALQVRARAVGVRTVLPLMVCFIPSFLLLGVVPTVVSAVSHALG